MIDEVARAEIASHKQFCLERHAEIHSRFNRLEKILITAAGSAILTLAQVVFRVF